LRRSPTFSRAWCAENFGKVWTIIYADYAWGQSTNQARPRNRVVTSRMPATVHGFGCTPGASSGGHSPVINAKVHAKGRRLSPACGRTDELEFELEENFARMTPIGTPELVLLLVALGGMTAAATWAVIELKKPRR